MDHLTYFTGDVPMEILARVIETITDPSKMVGPQVDFMIVFNIF